MIVIDDILISEDVVEQQFICDLSKCKGGCCEDGDAGAPLSNEELKLVDTYFETIKDMLPAASIEQIEKHGRYQYHAEFGWVTPTLPSDNEICVYAIRESDGMIKCAFEKAYNEGKISWKKPISCHLYPIIAKKGKYGDYDRVNYQPREQLCRTGCELGEKMKVPVYQFLKEPLIRKYGEDFYEALDTIAKNYYQTGDQIK